MDEIWQIEEDFWLKGVEVFEATLADQCLMAFPGIGILDRAAIIASLRSAPRWAAVEMTERRMAVTQSTVVLAYRAEGRRDRAARYRALCTSTYLQIGGAWRMAQHQQTLA